MYQEQRKPARLTYPQAHNPREPSGTKLRADVLPYVVTTYQLTAQFAADSRSRCKPYIAELRPELFCEVSPELAAERGLVHGDWATIVTARNAIEARVLVTERVAPLRVAGAVIHQIGITFHVGPNALPHRDAANELSAIDIDPDSQIQEVKALSADIRPGRRPRGSALSGLMESYQQRAGITAGTGMQT